MTTFRVLLPVFLLAACVTPATDPLPEDQSPSEVPRSQDLGLLWVKHAAEFEAVSLQAYVRATAHLQKFVEDSAWSALPGQTDAADLRPAVILDFDSTVLNHVKFQMSYERPFENWKLDKYDRDTIANPVPGVVEFMTAAREAGVTLFFVTNRPCELRDGIDDPCPQRQTVIDGLAELGFDVAQENVMLSQERGWNREKSTRRQHIAQNYRVIMLIGDDLTDFIPCMRSSPRAPCTNNATEESRRQATRAHAEYWGNGWYILPNPMHGSWTSAR